MATGPDQPGRQFRLTAPVGGPTNRQSPQVELGIDVLLVCTANLCRSPMTEYLLRARLVQVGVPATVSSAGLLPGGHAPPADGVQVMSTRGIDTSGHVSRTLQGEMIGAADLILGMGREHVRAVVRAEPRAWSRSFTLKEMVRRGKQVGPRAPGQALDQWLAQVGAGRLPADLVGSSADDDVGDPIGRSPGAWEQVAGELSTLVDRLVDLIWPSSPERSPSGQRERSGVP